MKNFNLFEDAKKKIIIAAHRGVSGGNIPCNTMTAYETALKQGADMIEVDVDKTKDDVLVIFHPGMEKEHLRLKDKTIHDMTWDEVKELRYVNYDRTPTQFGLPRFEDVLEQFRGRCYINVDKFWENPEAIYKAISKQKMQDQVLVKSSISDHVIQVLEEVAPDVPFLGIVKETHPRHEELLHRNIRYMGAEVLFSSDESEVCSKEFIDKMHQDGKLVWANAIIYNYQKQLSAGHSDDTALSQDMGLGWGWLADHNFDFIQTDWPLMLKEYLERSGKLFRK